MRTVPLIRKNRPLNTRKVWLLLAFLAVMAASAANSASFQGLAAVGAGLIKTAIDLQVVLELPRLSLTVSVIAKSGAAVLNALCQNFFDAAAQAFNLSHRKGSSLAIRPNPRHKQGFIGIDVADARDKVLIQKQIFYGSLAPLQNLFQVAGAKLLTQRLFPQPGKEALGILKQP